MPAFSIYIRRYIFKEWEGNGVALWVDIGVTHNGGGKAEGGACRDESKYFFVEREALCDGFTIYDGIVGVEDCRGGGPAKDPAFQSAVEGGLEWKACN